MFVLKATLGPVLNLVDVEGLLHNIQHVRALCCCRTCPLWLAKHTSIMWWGLDFLADDRDQRPATVIAVLELRVHIRRGIL